MRAIVSKLKRKLRKNDTAERCGLVLKDGTVIEVENKAEDPANAFRIDAGEIVKHEADLLGSWHTHPGQSANLSQEDYDGFSNWPSLTHFIVGTDGVRAFAIDEDVIVEVDL